MKPAPLQLSRCVIGAVHIVPCDENPDTTRITVTVTPTFGRSDRTDREWMVHLKLVFGGADGLKSSYSGEVDIQGFFAVEPDYPAEKMNKLVAVTCPTMLYGTARDLVASVTGRGRFGSFLLPTVSFTDQDLIVETGAALPRVVVEA